MLDHAALPRLLYAPSSLQCRPMVSSHGFVSIAKQRLEHIRVEASPTNELGFDSELLEGGFAEAPSKSPVSSFSSPSPSLVSERGISFSTGSSFFRVQSSLGRDLAVLAATLYKRSQGRLRALDAMSGCGVRALRYLVQAEADFVLVNDCNTKLHFTIVDNMSRYMPFHGLHSPPSKPFIDTSSSEGPQKHSGTGNGGSDDIGSEKAEHSRTDTFFSSQLAIGIEGFKGHSSIDDQVFKCGGSNSTEVSSALKASLPFQSRACPFDTQCDIKAEASSKNIRWQVCHEEAARLFAKCNLKYDFYDLIDIDSFGSDSYFLGPALSALRFGGLLFVTCTDGFSSAGHRPYNSLAQYGTFMRPMPYANELGLRMLMGAVVKEAALRNMSVSPIFSIYAPHGPVFRVLLRSSAGKPEKITHYGFIYYCAKCGGSGTVSWEKLGSTCCPCSEKFSDSLKISGPLWTGPLHNTEDVQNMICLAKEWGWISNLSEHELISNSTGGKSRKKQDKLWDLLYLMLEESHPKLPFGFIHLDELGKRGKIQSPRRDILIKVLQSEGYIATRSHVCSNAVKTNCSMVSCIALARRLAGSEGRLG